MIYVGGEQLEEEYWTFWLYDSTTGQWLGQGLDYVEWTGERLDRGYAALNTAITCLV